MSELATQNPLCSRLNRGSGEAFWSWRLSLLLCDYKCTKFIRNRVLTVWKWLKGIVLIRPNAAWNLSSLVPQFSSSFDTVLRWARILHELPDVCKKCLGTHSLQSGLYKVMCNCSCIYCPHSFQWTSVKWATTVIKKTPTLLVWWGKIKLWWSRGFLKWGLPVVRCFP